MHRAGEVAPPRRQSALVTATGAVLGAAISFAMKAAWPF